GCAAGRARGWGATGAGLRGRGNGAEDARPWRGGGTADGVCLSRAAGAIGGGRRDGRPWTTGREPGRCPGAVGRWGGEWVGGGRRPRERGAGPCHVRCERGRSADGGCRAPVDADGDHGTDPR